MKKAGQVRSRHFLWRIYNRDGIFYADGRTGNRGYKLGRCSLDSGDYETAIANLQQLDTLRAIEFGLVKPSSAESINGAALSLASGRAKYFAHLERPDMLGGVKLSTLKRYRAVFDKFMAFAESQHIATWNAVDSVFLGRYATWLDDNGYQYATGYLELTTLKQVISWLIDKAKLLPETCRISLELKKPQDTSTYCYAVEEVKAIIEYCQGREDLRWIGDVIVALVHTGMRVGELVSLHWGDVIGDLGHLEVRDQSRSGTRDDRRNGRSTKGHRSRRIPIHPSLYKVLDRLRTQPHADGRIFHGPEGGLLNPDRVRIVLQREILEPLSARFPAKPGCEGLRDGRLHSFRHYFCSQAANQRMPREALMRLLGHRDSQMVARYYHLKDEDSSRLMKTMTMVPD